MLNNHTGDWRQKSILRAKFEHIKQAMVLKLVKPCVVTSSGSSLSNNHPGSFGRCHSCRQRANAQTVTETDDVAAMMAITKAQVSRRIIPTSSKLIDARKSLLAQLWAITEDPEITDFAMLKRLSDSRRCLLERIDERSHQINPGPHYQRPRPLVTTLGKFKKKHRPHMQVSRQSDAQVLLYHKLKADCKRDVLELKRLCALEAAIMRERHKLQQTAQELNKHLAENADAYYLPQEPCLDELIEAEIEARTVNAKKPAKLVKRRNPGELQLLRERRERYDDVRILPWDGMSRESRTGKPWRTKSSSFRSGVQELDRYYPAAAKYDKVSFKSMDWAALQLCALLTDFLT